MSRFGVVRPWPIVWISIASCAAFACDTGEDAEPARDTGSPGAPDAAPDAAIPDAPDAASSAEDLSWAPPAEPLDDGLAVAMDIVSLEAHVVFDLERATAQASAVMTFRSGEQSGRPVFDLRQALQSAELDGAPLDVARLAHRALSGPYGSEMRVIDVNVPARSEHVLALEYALHKPDVLVSHDVAAPELDAARVRWAFNLADYTAAHFLEQWLPANLIFDRHPVRLELELIGTDVPHALVTTGEVRELGSNHFEVRFPATTAAHSPLLVLRPASELSRRSTRHVLPDGASVEVRTASLADADVDLAAVEQMVIEALDDFVRSVGPYQHGEAFTLFVGAGYAMEYDGGATVYFEYAPDATQGRMNPSRQTVRHEVFHNWFGRGMQPSGQDHGWIDEAWDTYLNDFTADGSPLRAAPLPESMVSKLVGSGPYARDMVSESDPYYMGALVFAAIADRIGTDALTGQMRDFYLAHRGERYDTAMLERALVCANDDAAIRDIFQRHVYGDMRPAAPLELASFCAGQAEAPSAR